MCQWRDREMLRFFYAFNLPRDFFCQPSVTGIKLFVSRDIRGEGIAVCIAAECHAFLAIWAAHALFNAISCRRFVFSFISFSFASINSRKPKEKAMQRSEEHT